MKPRTRLALLIVHANSQSNQVCNIIIYCLIIFCMPVVLYIDMECSCPYSFPFTSTVAFFQVEKPADDVTPSQQHAMRTTQGKNLTRGRKPKKGKAAKAKAKAKAKKASKTCKTPPKTSKTSSPRSSTGKRKLATLRTMKYSPSKTNGTAAEDLQDDEPAPTIKKGKGRAKANTSSNKRKASETKPRGKTSKVKTEALEEKATGSEGPREYVATTKVQKVHQERVGTGKGWRYNVLRDQKYGCTNCRFIYGGCQNCRKATFRGKSAAQIREEERAALTAAAATPCKAAAKGTRKIKGKAKKSKRSKETDK